jgi:hypothetical protein
MDLELMDWLNRYTFPEEEKYADLDYAQNPSPFPRHFIWPRWAAAILFAAFMAVDFVFCGIDRLLKRKG